MAASTASRKRKKARPLWVRRLKQTLAVLTLIFLIIVSVGSFMFVQELKAASEAMGSLNDLRDRVTVEPSILVSADGRTLYRVSTEFRKPVTYSQVPARVRNAILAAEDKRFFEHQGVDYIALARGVVENVKERRLAQGGSTLTMQLSKLLFSSSEKTLQRKMRDMAMAVTIEQRLSKEEILELYMNKVYFGKGAWGIQAAANVYFAKPVDKLTVAEAALLARLIRRPSDENPFNDLDAAIRNRNVVLGIMRDENMITPGEYEESLREKVHLNPHAPETSARLSGAPYFVQHALTEFQTKFPNVHLEEGGYRIETTLQYDIQKIAEREVAKVVNQNRDKKVTNAAFVLMDADGKILAEVGGVNFEKDQFNVVTQGRRQPGSAFKPFVYGAAFAMGVLNINDSISNDRYTYRDPVTGQAWSPDNSHNRYGGSVSVRTAFTQSLNVPAARVMEKVGPDNCVAMAEGTFGFRPGELRPFMSLALGSSEVSPLEMAQAYSVFMLRGDRATPYLITRVIEPDGTIQSYGPEIRHTGLDPGVCEQMDELMRGVVTSGTGRKANEVPDARGKTGTTSDNKDAWFCGYSDGLVGIGWIGNVRHVGKRPVYEPMARSVFGGTVTIDFWTSIMKAAHEKYSRKLEKPMPDETDSVPKPDKKGDEPGDVPVIDPDATDNVPAPAATTGGEGVPSGPAPKRGPGETLPPTSDTQPPPTQPATPPRRSDPPDTAPPGDEDMVEVEVCADTGMKASIYCPETVTRRFKRGHEPKRRCTKHTGQ